MVFQLIGKPNVPTSCRFSNWLENRTQPINATVELRRQPNGALGMKAFGGLVVLEVREVMSAEAHPLQHQRNPM